MYNDIVTTIGRGNGAMLVLLDLSAAFDTIDHDNLFCILEKYVGICGNALKLIKSYFSNRTQRVQIDNVLSDFANIICGVPQGSVLGPLKFCLYLLPLSAILRYHNIGYHVYADDTQLYVSFKCKQPLEAISKLNSCLADIRKLLLLVGVMVQCLFYFIYLLLLTPLIMIICFAYWKNMSEFVVMH